MAKKHAPVRGMAPKQVRFVAEYLVDLNATQAAIRAGYSKKTAEDIGRQLLRKTPVAEAVAEGKRKQLEKAELSAARVLEELRRLAFFDPGTMFRDGKLLEIYDMPSETRAAIAGFEQAIANRDPTDGKRSTNEWLHKWKIWSKTDALDSLCKHFGLLTEKVEHSGGIDIAWKDSE